jgi:protoheme ferro-lyase
VAQEIGLEHYRRAPALNCREDFIEAIAHLVKGKVESDE